MCAMVLSQLSRFACVYCRPIDYILNVNHHIELNVLCVIYREVQKQYVSVLLIWQIIVDRYYTPMHAHTSSLYTIQQYMAVRDSTDLKANIHEQKL